MYFAVWFMDYRISYQEAGFNPMISAEKSAENLDGYRYAFQGQERDDEVDGVGNSYTATFWQYDPRLARRWNQDPVVKSEISPYQVLSNRPTVQIDPFGDDDFFSLDGRLLFSTKTGNNVRVVSDPTKVADAMYIYRNSKNKDIAMTNFLRRSSKNVADVNINKTYKWEGMNKIMSHYGRKVGYDKEISGTAKVPGIMATSGGSLDPNRSDQPRIFYYIPRYANDRKISPLLNTAANIENVIVHEQFHVDNHYTFKGNGVYTEVPVGMNQGDMAINNHLYAYDAQLTHESWEGTTQNFKQATYRYMYDYVMELSTDEARQGAFKYYSDEYGVNLKDYKTTDLDTGEISNE